VSDDLVVKVWKRFGHDRSYVQTGSGQRVGYRDNITGEVVVEDESYRADMMRSLGLEYEPPAPAEPYAIVIPQLARDLSGNTPGESARARAREERAAAPMRAILARVLGAHTDERAWRVGAKGEEVVGDELDKLRKHGWVVLHDVPVGARGANIDHVVIGPAGVFSVNAKYHWDVPVWVGKNTVKVNGHFQPYVQRSRHEAKRASRLLGLAVGHPVPTVGVVAIVSQFRKVASQPPEGDVFVCGPREARERLAAMPALLPADEQTAIAQAARRSTTWTS
jgi:hypothetical protein